MVAAADEYTHPESRSAVTVYRPSDELEKRWQELDPLPGAHACFEPVAHKNATVVTVSLAGPKKRLVEELRKFKQLMEAGEIATIKGQPSGRRRTPVPPEASPILPTMPPDQITPRPTEEHAA